MFSPILSVALTTRASSGEHRGVIIDVQTDFCGRGGYVDKMGYDLSLTRAPIEPIKKVIAAHARMVSVHTRRGHRPDLSDLREQAMAEPADRRGIGDPGLRQDPPVEANRLKS
jgi:nicotinamidase-related amidase